MRVEHAAAANWRKDEGERQLRAHHACPQIGGRCDDRAFRAECNVFVYPRIFAQRDFGIRAAIDVIKNHPRQTFLREAPKIRDVEYVWRCDGGH
jgi:hypothetical protein